jgi:transcriptional regulator with XRE-family HTH domain|nr:helix-turn-helix transcriptional regulator [uncultured Flavobacterium sp.]
MDSPLEKIELYIIEKVKEIRKSKKISQQVLSLAIGKGTSFISDIEAPSKTAKYNVLHLNLIAKALDCSPKDFWPDEPVLEEKDSEVRKAEPKRPRKN